MAKIGFDLQFFPALRETLQEPMIVEVRKRNDLRLEIMKTLRMTVYRPQLIAQMLEKQEKKNDS